MEFKTIPKWLKYGTICSVIMSLIFIIILFDNINTTFDKMFLGKLWMYLFFISSYYSDINNLFGINNLVDIFSFFNVILVILPIATKYFIFGAVISNIIDFIKERMLQKEQKNKLTILRKVPSWLKYGLISSIIMGIISMFVILRNDANFHEVFLGDFWINLFNLEPYFDTPPITSLYFTYFWKFMLVIRIAIIWFIYGAFLGFMKDKIVQKILQIRNRTNKKQNKSIINGENRLWVKYGFISSVIMTILFILTIIIIGNENIPISESFIGNVWVNLFFIPLFFTSMIGFPLPSFPMISSTIGIAIIYFIIGALVGLIQSLYHSYIYEWKIVSGINKCQEPLDHVLYNMPLVY